jgi:hypothetical protein
MSESTDIPAFGVVDQDGEHGIFSIATGAGGYCSLTLVARTERGYPRRELAAIPLATWRRLATAAQKELLRGMGPEETGGVKSLAFRNGEQALSPLATRELALLLWSLMEDGEGTHIDALLAGWRQLAREERWWLYARASNPTQRQGHGWRRALFFALTDPADTRTAPRMLELMETATAQKKTSTPMPSVTYPTGPTRKSKKAGAPTSAGPSKKKAAKKAIPAKKSPKKLPQ